MIRSGVSGITDAMNPGKDKLFFDMAVFTKDGDQILADMATSTGGESTDDIHNPEIRFTREACAVIAYKMDSDTVSMITRQAERHQPRIYVSTSYEGNDAKGPGSRAMTAVINYAFPLVCFCVVPTDAARPDLPACLTDRQQDGGELPGWGQQKQNQRAAPTKSGHIDHST